MSGALIENFVGQRASTGLNKGGYDRGTSLYHIPMVVPPAGSVPTVAYKLAWPYEICS